MCYLFSHCDRCYFCRTIDEPGLRPDFLC